MRSLTLKLVLAFLAVSLVGTLVLALLAGRTTASAFDTFVLTQEQEELVTRLEDYYQFNRSWEGVTRLSSGGGSGMGPGAGGGVRQGQGRGAPLLAGVALAMPDGTVVAPGGGHRIGTQVPAAELDEGIPIEVEGQVVGILVGRPITDAPGAAATGFLQRVNRALVIAAAVATVAALLLAILLARTVTRPLRALTQATGAVARGQLGESVPVSSQDELGQLTAAFNRMSSDLAEAQARRQQLTSDIAHDLRTPISIIQGHAEALRDGVLPPTSETFDLIHDEASRLHRLVEDLRTLSQAEAGELTLVQRLVSPEQLLQQIAAARQPQAAAKEIGLSLDIAPHLPELLVDPDRMAQVLNNLVDNALRHTPAGGQVHLAAARQGQTVTIRIQDSGPGIAPEDLPHIFERFYRGDKSRRRHNGGSGLGLAIARSIIRRHGGEIEAESRPGEGATFIVSLPVPDPAAVPG